MFFFENKFEKACVEVSLEENIDLSSEDVTKKNINGRIVNKAIVQQFQSKNEHEVQPPKSRDFYAEGDREAQTKNALKKVRSLFFESYFVF